MATELEEREQWRRLREENQALDGIARAAAAWCAEHPDEGTPLLRDLLHAHGYDPRPREPDPDVWFPAVETEAEEAGDGD